MENLESLWAEVKAQIEEALVAATEDAKSRLEEIMATAQRMYDAAKAELQECADALATAMRDAANVEVQPVEETTEG
jgi:ElaB/YqjD/DUF883 family membrane-anchored ribosome-binding protein